MMQRKNSNISLKKIELTNDYLLISGYASVFDQLDEHNEIIARGAFSSSIKKCHAERIKLPMLFNHNVNCIIGVWDEIHEDEYGLYVEGRIFLDDNQGRSAASKIQGGSLRGLSIGYIPKRISATPAEGNKRHNIIEELSLKEVSVVTIPAQELARILAAESKSSHNNNT